MKNEKSNEQIVAEIRANINVTANYDLLFQQNQNLIRKIVKPFADSSGEDVADLMQESFFALITACEHYESSENVKFMSYASFWIKQAARNYINKCGLLKLPSNESVKVRKYKRFCSEFERDRGYVPGDDEVANVFHYSVEDIDRIKSISKGMSSLDTPLADTDSFTLGDTLAADCDLENEAIENYMDEQKKNELWGIVAAHVTQQENAVIRDYYLRGFQMPDIARKYGLSHQRIAQVKRGALNRLRYGRARKELQECFWDMDARCYHNGVKTFKRTFESNVQRLAIERVTAQERYKATTMRLNQIDYESLRVRKEEIDREYQRVLQQLENNG